tara:strand:+ start:904 stop:1080 length:177 start_codon:yes stop_codon:yes gene_type:complete
MKDRISKRVFGAATYVVGLGMAICSGFGFYNIDSMLVLAVLGNGTALLGLDTFKPTKN